MLVLISLLDYAILAIMLIESGRSVCVFGSLSYLRKKLPIVVGRDVSLSVCLSVCLCCLYVQLSLVEIIYFRGKSKFDQPIDLKLDMKVGKKIMHV